MARIVLVHNPTAGGGRHRSAGRVVAGLLEAAGHAVVEATGSDERAARAAAAEALDAGADALVVVGGDGMVHLGAGLVGGTPTPLGIVATGTGNDSARTLGLPRGDVVAGVAAVVVGLASPPRRIDLLRVVDAAGEAHWCVEAVSVGFDAAVNDRANRMRFPRGGAKYVVALLAEILRLRPVEATVEIDGAVSRRPAILLTAANGPTIGGGMRAVPGAVPDDGLLDLLVVAPLGRLAFLRIFPSVYRGTHVRDRRIEVLRARSVLVRADGPIAYADGERIGPLPIRIECVPAALRVLGASTARSPRSR